MHLSIFKRHKRFQYALNTLSETYHVRQWCTSPHLHAVSKNAWTFSKNTKCFAATWNSKTDQFTTTSLTRNATFRVHSWVNFNRYMTSMLTMAAFILWMPLHAHIHIKKPDTKTIWRCWFHTCIANRESIPSTWGRIFRSELLLDLPLQLTGWIQSWGFENAACGSRFTQNWR